VSNPARFADSTHRDHTHAGVHLRRKNVRITVIVRCTQDDHLALRILDEQPEELYGAKPQRLSSHRRAAWDDALWMVRGPSHRRAPRTSDLGVGGLLALSDIDDC
jgi:hypothetical protein